MLNVGFLSVSRVKDKSMEPYLKGGSFFGCDWVLYKHLSPAVKTVNLKDKIIAIQDPQLNGKV